MLPELRVSLGGFGLQFKAPADPSELARGTELYWAASLSYCVKGRHVLCVRVDLKSKEVQVLMVKPPESRRGRKEEHDVCLKPLLMLL